VDVEGKKAGINPNVVTAIKDSPLPITYAGGVSSLADIQAVGRLGDGRVDVSVGSALTLFGGHLDLVEAANAAQNYK